MFQVDTPKWGKETKKYCKYTAQKPAEITYCKYPKQMRKAKEFCASKWHSCSFKGFNFKGMNAPEKQSSVS